MRKLVTVAVLVSALGGAVGTTAQAQQRHWLNWKSMVFKCEAIGVTNPWYANTGNGFFFGPQFTPATWHSEGGGPVREMGDPDAPPMRSYSIQYITRIAINTYRDQGPGAWPTCHPYLYS